MTVLQAAKVAVIGDIHGKWNERDNEYFDGSDYDLLLFVGDLGSGTLKNGLEIVRLLSKLRRPGLILPGNNDALHLPQLHAELAHQSGKKDLLRVVRGAPAAGIETCGFSRHSLEVGRGNNAREITLIAGRPCAMGGSEFSFREEVNERHGVASLEGARRKMQHLINGTTTRDVIFLAHNGPFGLGEGPGDPWGRDFQLPQGLDAASPRDWGDSDLRHAIEYAQKCGKRVLAVIAGHMHRGRHGAGRALVTEKEGSTYINPAVVPRINRTETGETHHHVRMEIETQGTGIQVTDVFVELAVD